MTVFYVVFLFAFFKNFVCKTKAKSVNKENDTVVEITGTWSLDTFAKVIKWSKGLGVEVSNSTENLGMLYTTLPSESKVKP